MKQSVEELRSLLENATPGPWMADRDVTGEYTDDGQTPLYWNNVFGCDPREIAPGFKVFSGNDLLSFNHRPIMSEDPKMRREDAQLIAAAVNALPALLDRLASVEAINTEWVELADRANANKPSHDVVWVVERNYGSGTSSDWRYMKYPGYLDDAWTSDWNEALKCYDRPSADSLCTDMPDDYDVRITDHQIVFPSFLEWLRAKAADTTGDSK